MADRALGELGHQGLGDAGHFEAELLGVAPGPAVPAPPQLLGQQVAEHALVQLGEGDHGLEQAPGIERAPRAVGDRRARLATTTWSWSWGSPALESQWVKAAATTPSTSSWTTPLVPEREWNTSRSA